MSVLRFHLLGPLEARRDGIPLELGPRKQRAVLALLLLNANRVVPTERLIDELWGDSPPETARSALQVYVAGLRKALGAGRRRATDGVARLRARRASRGRSISIASRRSRAEARAATDRARRADAPARGARALAGRAARPSSRSEPFAPRRPAQLEQLRLGALEERIDADLALGRHAQLIRELNGLVASTPYHEPLPRAADARALPRRGGRPMRSRRTARRARLHGRASGSSPDPR